MTEADERRAVVEAAKSWMRTPYAEGQLCKGAGVDCGMLLVGVYREAGMLDPAYDPRPYPPQWHLHQTAERYLGIVESFCRGIEEAEARPGDVVLFRWPKIFAHGAIVLEWPTVIHAMGPPGNVTVDINVEAHLTMRALDRRFFSPWPRRT